MKPYYTIVIFRANASATNIWNDFRGLDFESMTRGNFETEKLANERAREMFLDVDGALFEIQLISE